MGLVERLLERQIAKGPGSRRDNIRDQVRTQRLLIAAAVLNGLSVLVGLASGARLSLLLLGLSWLGFTFLVYKRHRYLRVLSSDT